MKYKFKIKVDKYTSLERTLNCGQCFRFEYLSKGEFLLIAKDKFVCLKQENNNIWFSCSELEYESFWKNYFDMHQNYDNTCRELSLKDKRLAKIINKIPGIRILRQDCFEVLISFIISQNNNIPRIKGIISRLCEAYGICINKEFEIYSFPEAKILASLQEKDLNLLRCGFRDKYILDAARKVYFERIDLKKLGSQPIAEARANLMQIYGVGPKVADCVLLYGCHRLEAFPMDVWMRRIMGKYYPNKTYDIFGNYAGIAQQYLYYYERSLKIGGK